ncbi:MAG: hypothetical protein HKN33_08665 [Pyrinomonadaceae bacterium]|nr:hypothetical protein [Pyrinomonadaceae bacterium]
MKQLFLAFFLLLIPPISTLATTNAVGRDTSSALTTSIADTEPVMLDHTILENFRLAASNGRLQIDKLRAMNLPQNVANKNALTLRYKNAAGEMLASFTGMPLPPGRNPSWLMNYFRADDGPSSDFKFSVGDYSLEFVVNGKAFDDFKFSIGKHKYEDGSERLIANGPWERLAFLEDMKARRPQPLKFSFYMRDFLEGTGKRSSSWGKYKATITKGGKEIAVSNPEGNRTIAPLRMWRKYDLTFEKTGSNGYYLNASDLKTDGKYLITFEHEGSVYGKYEFSVAGGKIKGVSEHDGNRLGSDGTIFWMVRQQ